MARLAFALAVNEAAGFLRPEMSLLLITGAGMSADSGLPTYRGIGGLYSDGNLADEGYPIEVVLSGPMFRQRPEVTWKALKQLAAGARGARPNRGHEVLAEMEGRFDRVWVLTQNVDGLHLRAGSKNVIDIHGDMRRLHCLRCDWSTMVETDNDYDRLLELTTDQLPSCPQCGGLIRPDIVLFNELLPDAKIHTLRRELSRGFDAIGVIGTTAVFPYIAAPVHDARRRGIPTFEINPDESEISEIVDLRIEAGASATLDAIWRCYQGLHPDAG